MFASALGPNEQATLARILNSAKLLYVGGNFRNLYLFVRYISAYMRACRPLIIYAIELYYFQRPCL